MAKGSYGFMRFRAKRGVGGWMDCQYYQKICGAKRKTGELERAILTKSLLLGRILRMVLVTGPYGMSGGKFSFDIIILR